MSFIGLLRGMPFGGVAVASWMAVGDMFEWDATRCGVLKVIRMGYPSGEMQTGLDGIL